MDENQNNSGRNCQSSRPPSRIPSPRMGETAANSNYQLRARSFSPEQRARPGTSGCDQGGRPGGPPRQGSSGGAKGAARAGHDHHMHSAHYDHMESSMQFDERACSALSRLSQIKRTPSYTLCTLSRGLDFSPCDMDKKKDKIRSLPEKVCLRQEEIEQLVQCETRDVESAVYLISDSKKTYKKPCPKQQKAQMAISALLRPKPPPKPCNEEFSPLEHPDPEDISPELAAAMMFAHEEGIKMNECPDLIISHLFPDAPKPKYVPKDQGNLSGEHGSLRDIARSISGSRHASEASDSAYTRTMRDKEDQRSFDVDFAIGQSKREYVLVTRKPQRVSKAQYRGGGSPPWFPGYLMALPDEDGLKIMTSPSRVLQKAWVHSNPKNLPTDDVVVLE